MGNLNTSKEARNIIVKYSIVTPFKTGIPYIFDGGWYNCIDSLRRIENIINLTYENMNLSQTRLNEIKSKVINLSYFNVPLENNEYISVENGLLNLDTLKLESVDRGKFVTCHIPVNYDIEVSTRPIEKYIGEIVLPSHIDKLQDHCGNILAPHYTTKKLLYCIGTEHSGKSTFFNILENVVGSLNCSHLSLNDLGHRFRASKIYGKRLNICSDIEYSQGVNYIGRIKSLTGGDTIPIEFKHKDPFDYRPIAKQFFSGNGIPCLRNGYGDVPFFARWDFCEFPHQFDMDSSIEKKYKSEEMKTAFFNWMIQGYIRLKENDWIISNFTPVDEVMAIFNKSEYQIDNFIVWLNENCIREPTNDEPKNDLCRDYLTWCRDRNLIPICANIKSFGFRMKEQKIIPVIDTRPSINGSQIRCYRGIRLVKEK